MKHKFSFLLTALILLISIPYAEAATCDLSLSAGGKTITASFETIDGKYVMTLKANGSDVFTVPNPWYVGGSNWAPFVTSGDNTGTLVLTFSSQPNFSSGWSWYMNGNSSSAHTIYGYQMPSIDWSGTCGPVSGLSITSANASNITNNSADITIKATDTDGNINKVVIKNSDEVLLTQNVTPSTKSLDATYTISGLNKNTYYSLTIEVSDDASNTATKNVPFTTANNLESECSGVRGASSPGTGAPELDFKIMYDGKDVNFTIKSKDATKTLNSCEIRWALSTNENTTNTLNTTITDGTATAVLQNRNKGEILYIYFHYRAGAMGSPTSTANGTNWSSNKDKLIYYVVGDCLPPENIPYLTYAEFNTSSSTTVTLNVDGIININNQAEKIEKFEVSFGSTKKLFDITPEGTIKIDDLKPDTEYNFTIKAAYGDARSNNAETIIASTTSLTDNLALNKPVTVAYDEANKSEIVDGDEGSRWSTNGRPNITYDWLQVDLGELYYINSIKIKWEEARSNKYQILLSQDGENWFVWQHDGAPTKDVFTNYPIGGLAAQYIKVVSQANATGFGISIFELQAFGTGVEYTANSSAPTLNASLGTATNTQATIHVSATDNQSTPITLFEVDGKMYTAQDGKIVMEPLTPCMQYEWQVRAIDQEGNKSAPETITYETGNSSPDANIAVMKPTYTGFYEGNLVSSNATDGDNKTRWGGRYRPTGDDEWLVIDLQGLYKINRIEVAWETGTSINYEFKSAWTAEFEQVEVRGVNDDKSLQEPKMCDKLVAGHFSTFEHKNEQPSSAKATDTNDKSKVDSDLRAWDRYEYDEPVYARYIQLKSGLNAQYPASLWEFKVYGECADFSHIPVMQWAEVVSYTSDEAEIYVSALDYETSEEEMDYEVLVTCGEAGYKQLETIYKFTHEQFVPGAIGHLMVGGLIPDMQYELKIYAIDQDGNRSNNYKTISFTTRAEIGCIFSSTEAYNVDQSLGNGNHSTQIFQKGYTVTIVPGENEFTIIAETADDFAELDPTIFQLLTEPQYLPGGGVIEKVMTKVTDKEKTYSITIKKGDINFAPINNWTGTITFFIKYPFVNKGICLTQPITYDLSNACESAFIIFHHDDQPSSKSLIEYNGEQVNQSIRYYRHFTAGVWEDITMPFDVEEIKVYDTEDHQYYTLNAQYKDGGSTKKGKFLLRKQQDNVSGEQFVPSWYDGDTPMPKKHQPYAIRFTSSYYSDKYVLFCGAKGQAIETSFTKGTAPTADDQYMVFGNPTMMPHNVGTAYLLPADHSDETYRRTENATVRPFETYVLANANTTNVMVHIGPWRGTPSISTGWEDIEHTLAPQPIVHLYTITGQRLGTWYNCSMQSVADEWAMKGQAGCYIISAGAYTYKIMLK